MKFGTEVEDVVLFKIKTRSHVEFSHPSEYFAQTTQFAHILFSIVHFMVQICNLEHVDLCPFKVKVDNQT